MRRFQGFRVSEAWDSPFGCGLVSSVGAMIYTK
jgi:hypothetical protein